MSQLRNPKLRKFPSFFIIKFFILIPMLLTYHFILVSRVRYSDSTTPLLHSAHHEVVLFIPLTSLTQPPSTGNPNLLNGTTTKPAYPLPQRETLYLSHWSGNKSAICPGSRYYICKPVGHIHILEYIVQNKNC